MAMENLPDRPPAMRASDADRQRVVALLQSACADGRLTLGEFDERSAAAYAARTQDQLAELTRDLVPATATGTAPVPPYAGAPPSSAAPIVAVFSGARRVGRWRPARREAAVAVFGGVELDLRDAELPAGGMELSAWAVFGGVDVIVPEGTHVELSGVAVFGGRDVRGGEGPAGPDPFVLRVHAVAVFGGVNVKVRGPRRGRP